VTRGTSTSTSHANRGRGWEQLLELWHARYEARGQAVVLRTPPPMRILRSLSGGQFVAVYATEGPPDYVLLAAGLAVAAEAKDCVADRWQLAKLHPHQARRLTAWEAQGGLGVVLLRHQPSSTQWVLPWQRLRPVWERWHEAAGTGRDLPRGSASVSLPQLHQLGLQFCAVDGHLPRLSQRQ
jgi:recombination protein U